MPIEHKTVQVGGVSEVKDEGDGIVTAYVSITGVEDNVKDVIEPGAYTKTLKKRMPKGVWGHQWTTPTSKTLDVKELMPGDPDLPAELSDGSPWPKEAGALRIKMQFNLGTTRGREAYSDVTFFGPQQEWSIGYTVPDGKSYKDAQGRRHIKELDLFEYSAVLFGAMSHARTHNATSVKDAQLAFKMMTGIPLMEIKSLEDAVEQFRKDHVIAEPIEASEGEATDFVGDEGDIEDALDEHDDSILDIADESDELVDDEESDLDPDDFDEVDDDDEFEDHEDEVLAEEKSLANILAGSMDTKDLRAAYQAIGKVLDVVEASSGVRFLEYGTKALIEAKATGYETIADAVDAIDVSMDPSDAKALRDAADGLDTALDSGDQAGAEESAADLFDVLEKVMDLASEAGEDDLSLKTVARTVADKASGTKPGDEEEDDWEDEPTSDGDDEDEDNYGRKAFGFTASNGIEYKNGPWAGREYGAPVGGEDLNVKERQRVFIGSLPNDALVSMDYLLQHMPGHMTLKSYVSEEIDDRLYAGRLTEEKMRMVRQGAGQQGRGGGRHRQAAEGRTPGSGKNFGETGWQKPPTAKRLRKATGPIKKPGTAPGNTVSLVRSGKKTVNRMAGGDQTEYKRDFSEQQRTNAARKGNARPDGSFPINNETDLKNAIRACGRAKDPEAAKAHIKKRAKAMGKEGMLPDSWKADSVVIDKLELKSLEALAIQNGAMS